MNQIDGIVVGGPVSSSAPVSQERRRGKRPAARGQNETGISFLLQKNDKFVPELIDKIDTNLLHVTYSLAQLYFKPPG